MQTEGTPETPGTDRIAKLIDPVKIEKACEKLRYMDKEEKKAKSAFDKLVLAGIICAKNWEGFKAAYLLYNQEKK